MLRVVRAAHVNDLGAEGLENFLDDGVTLGALAQSLLIAPRLVLGARGLVVRVAVRPRRDADADASAQNLAAHLAQQAHVLRPLQSVAQVLALRRELDAHLVAFNDHAQRAFERAGQEWLAAPFKPALGSAGG